MEMHPEVPIHIYLLFSIINYTSTFELFSSDCLVARNICPDPNINFFLYTSENPRNPVQLSVNDVQSLINAPFINGEIKFLIHGYTGHRDYSPNMELRPAYFQRNTPVNIISVDYSPLVKEGCYVQSVQNTGAIATCIAQFINDLLLARPDVTISRFHFLALSLGAQVASQIQNHLNGAQIERLTVLDAAFPLFYEFTTSSERRINKGDAKFMDAIHTNAGLKGVWDPVANVDFYANGGTVQPGCGTNLSCSHVRSAELYAASIDPSNKFLSYRRTYIDYLFGWNTDKNDVQLFGEYVNHEASGVYLFDTTDKPPYTRLESEEENHRPKET